MTANFSSEIIVELAKQLADGTIDRVPYPVLNGNKEVRKLFYKVFIKHQQDTTVYTKTCLAGIQFLVKK